MAGIYYGNGWDAQSLPFMSTKLLMANGTSYPITSVFPDGVLDTSALETYGIPKLSGTFAFAMFMANAAVSGNESRYCELLNNNILSADWRFDCALYSLLGIRH